MSRRGPNRHRRPDDARVQRFRPASIEDMVSKERAVLPCGCAIYVGRRVDDHKPTTAASACGVDHQALTDRANEVLAELLATTSGRLLVERCAQALGRAARELL